jgi:hypothetical protein
MSDTPASAASRSARATRSGGSAGSARATRSGGSAGSARATRSGGSADSSAGGSEGSSAPASTREAFLVEHKAARDRRNAAELGSAAWEQASGEVERIEVEIARLERAMDPPRL